MSANDGGPKWVDMPSASKVSTSGMEAGEDYHDLGMKYPDAPVPRGIGDVIVHRAILDDITGVGSLMDWISEGDLVIVEMTDLLEKDMELHLAVDKIQDFVERDLSGQVIRLGQSRLLLLPPMFESARIE
jgi:SepF-like predicted cell division protein (DUF552 family)